MAYSLVTADNWPDLCSELEIFAEAQGWSVEWNSFGQIGLESGNCHVAWGPEKTDGANPVLVTDTYPNPDVNYQDYRVFGALGKNLNTPDQYWGQQGSVVTVEQDSDRVFVNDLKGPFSEVHFFGNEDYIWVVIRVDADRWCHIGFGVLDKKGMTHPDVAFAVGVFWRWWDNSQTNGYELKRNMEYSQGEFGNKFWYKNGYRNYNLYLPDGVLDPAFGLGDDICTSKGLTNLPQISYTGPQPSVTDYGDTTMMTHVFWARQKPLTGGLPLIPVPVLYGDTDVAATLTCFLGEFPGVRLCDVSGVGIGEDIEFGSETWLAFPLKRRTGMSYDGGPSSYQWGLAFKKE